MKVGRIPALAAVAVLTPMLTLLPSGSFPVAGASTAGTSSCVGYDQTSQTVPVTVSASPNPIAPAGSLAAGQSTTVTVTAYDSAGACVAGGPVSLYFDGPGTAAPETAAACSGLDPNGSLGPNYSPCSTDANGQVLVVFTTPTPLPTGTSSTVGATTQNSSYTLSAVATSYDYPYCDVYTNGATVSSITLDRSPIAPAGSLPAAQNVTVNATAYDSDGNCVEGAPLYLAFTGLGTATVGVSAPLNQYWQQSNTTAWGTLPITYGAAATLPNGGTDTIYISPLKTATLAQADTDTYAYGTLSAQGVGTINGFEGQADNIAVGYFSTTNTFATAFTASIDWGDGTTSNGTVVSLGANSYEVTGSHPWSDENPAENVTVTVTEANGPSVTATSSAIIADQPITASGGYTLQGNARTAGTWNVGSFIDPDFEGFANYSATVNWGDGTAPTEGGYYTMGDGGNGVNGTHTYKRKGKYTVTITVTDEGGPSATTTDTAVISP